MPEAICRAISQRRLLEFSYDGKPRVVEPHLHATSRAGNEVLRAYQVRGGSVSGEPVGWKLFLVSEIRSLQTLEDQFANARPEYNPNDKQMTTIHCRL